MIGSLRYRIELLEETRVPDGCGGFTVTWNVIAEVWAEIKERAGGEEAPEAETRLRVTIRRRGDVKPSMRFRQGGRVFDIVSALEREGRWLVCDCIERIIE